MMFKHVLPSYKELPIRWADFGVLHRNELSGTLTGLTRVRRFQQDDAHIFCMLDQVDKEIEDFLSFLSKVYRSFGFDFEVELSTRPEKYIGNIENWDKAEEILENKIKTFENWKINKGDGAFYGPKIDVKIRDSLKREHQCGTIQLDFNLPERFDLKYVSENEGHNRPVLIHRAIFGSFERFIAILLEHTNGKLPFWVSPRQICIVPVSLKYLDYAKIIKFKFSQYEVVVDDTTNTLNKKIRSAEKLCFNYIFVVGENEEETATISVRKLNKNIGILTHEEVDFFLKKELLE
jgi:threonyl-tRNA synthetase